MDLQTQAEVEAATYLIVAEFNDETELTGTAFCYFIGGRLITCSHVISRIGANGLIEVANNIFASRANNDQTLTFPVTVIKNGTPNGPMLPADMNDPDTLDLAVLQIEVDANYPSIHFLQSPPAIGDTCFSFGAFEDDEEDVEYAMNEGQVTAVWKNPNEVDAIVRHNCPITQGFSGGPLTDTNGNVIGVNALEYPDNPARYAIAAEIVWDFIPE